MTENWEREQRRLRAVSQIGMQVSFDSVEYIPTLYSYRKGTPNVISTKYESLDYDLLENEFRIQEEDTRGYRYLIVKNLFKWLAFLQIGIFTAVVGAFVDFAIGHMISQKYVLLIKLIKEHESHGQIYVMLMWIMLNVLPFTLGCILVTYIEPMAAGSGIPLVKCYLNGVYIPRILRLKTLVVKAAGLAFSIIGGVASGKEGPMIHVGACVANLVGKGRISFLGFHWDMYKFFRDDQEKRDLVSAGAAAGVSAAFGASVGGVLFSLEEGASFWNQTLTWRIFFTSVVSKFFVNFIMSALSGHPGELEHPSLINMGTVDFKYTIYEVPIFALMGCIGGIMGSMWNLLNLKLSQFRKAFLRQNYLRVLEGIFISGLHAVIAFVMTYYVSECNDRPYTRDYSLEALCGSHKGSSNVVGTMWLATPQKSVNALVHDPPGTYQYLSLTSFAIAYYLLSCLTFGLSSSNGIFVPSLLTGAAWGRLLSVIVRDLLPLEWQGSVDSGKYALIGACAQLGGIVRMTISLTVIMMETSDNISFSFPIIITLICAKWIGDFFSEGIYTINIQLKNIPFLPPEPPPLAHSVLASDVMNAPAICVRGIERIGYIWDMLTKTTHNGFPIVEEVGVRVLRSYNDSADSRMGRIKGLILRSQIIFLLYNKLFYEDKDLWLPNITMDTFRDYYLKEIRMDDLIIGPEHMRYHLDLRPIMNNSPYTLLKNSSLPRIFVLFRALGLRHLPIVNESNEVVGMITRKDLSRFKVYNRMCHLLQNELILIND